MNSRHSAKYIGERARGRWPQILMSSGISEGVLRNRHGPCPGCGGRDRFRFDDKEGRGTFVCSQGGADVLSGDGFTLLQHAHGWSFTEAMRFVTSIVDNSSDASRLPPPCPPDGRCESGSGGKAGEIRPHQEKIQRGILSECSQIMPDGPVAQYLIRRGLARVLQDLPCDLLEHPRLRYYESGKEFVEHPAMLAVVRGPAGTRSTLHRTYLSQDGQKAGVSAPRKFMKSVNEGGWTKGAVQLYAAEEHLALAEGIESALAVRVATGWPVWSGLTAAGLQAVLLPPSVKEVRVHVDHDEAGLRAGNKLAQRLASEGRRVKLIVPPGTGMDPLDWLGSSRVEAA